MTYCNMDTEDIKRFQSVHQTESLKEWFLGIVGQYEKMGQIPDRVERKEKCFDPGGAFSLCLPGRAEKS